MRDRLVGTRHYYDDVRTYTAELPLLLLLGRSWCPADNTPRAADETTEWNFCFFLPVP